MASTSNAGAPTRPPTNKNRGVCRYYNVPGGCFAGQGCKFLHVAPTASLEGVMSPYDANKTCRYYLQGYCRRGAACWFKHQVPDATPASTSRPQAPAAKPAPNDEEDHLCAICLDKPEEYGVLEGCNHVFCKDCIHGWRDSQGKSVDVIISQMNKTCPSCRQRSRFVIPCNRFPETDERKQKLIENYKASMSRVDCKYFTASRDKPFCPYGRDCFYKHELPDGTPYVFKEGVEELMERWKRRRQDIAMAGGGAGEAEFIRAIRNIADQLFEVAAGVIRVERVRGQVPISRPSGTAVPVANGSLSRNDDDDDDGPPPLQALSDDESDVGENSEEDDSDSDPEFTSAIAQSLRALEDSLRQAAAAASAHNSRSSASAPPRSRSPDPNRQFDVFDLD
ncbi:hypothetical protein EXIGLDRAFT_831997 [Exidia glandulosa HHB12029]|uniref:Uncharacterized protein n=1 Tax=Exidia glandulosa HHB12029 TaxID=1314781 RepID=A0A165M588_EXIGL|nr:hypothetical protein EXIGLDRAFT_831997 [Exidia glandulosa HHB12029]